MVQHLEPGVVGSSHSKAPFRPGVRRLAPLIALLVLSRLPNLLKFLAAYDPARLFAAYGRMTMCWPLKSGNTALIEAHLATRDAQLLSARSSIPTYDDVRKEILSGTITEIVAGIQSKKWTSTIVVSVFIHASIKAQENTHCLTEVNFDAALRRAKQLDDEFLQTGKLIGPLHGIPFSLKDQYSLKGKHSSTGYSEWLKLPPSEKDCALAQIAQHLGAICLVKTNVPQTMLNFECRNPVWGQTNNPYSKDHTCGGSSGGEGALLSCGGTAFGFGSDIGGSLRIPTSYCGIYALKASNGRSWPRNGNIDMGPRPRAVESVAGPMCRTVADLELLLRLFYTVLFPSPDSSELPSDIQRRFGVETMPVLPLRAAWLNPLQAAHDRLQAQPASQDNRKALRIGYYECDGMTLTSPACMRAVQEARAALHNVKTANGDKAVEMVQIDPARLQVAKTFKAFAALNSINKYEHLLAHKGSDPLDPTLALAMKPARSKLINKLVQMVARYGMGDKIMPDVVKSMAGRDAQVYFKYEYEQEQLTRQFERRIWNDMDLDAIICPVQAGVAVPHYGSSLLPSLAASTILYNVLGNAVTIVPVTRVDAEIDSHLPDSPQYKQWMNMQGRETCSRMVSKNLYKQYNSRKDHGLPVGVQVVTRQYEDEKAVGIAKLLDNALNKQDSLHLSQFGPGVWEEFAKRQANKSLQDIPLSAPSSLEEKSSSI